MDFLYRTAIGALLCATLALAACGTPAAKDFGGSWKPLNQFQSKTTAIPLSQEYTFYASPMDGTLKTMLTRWAGDSGMTPSYKLNADYTLSRPVSTIHTTSIAVAASELSSIYSAQSLSVASSNNQIVVEPASAVQRSRPIEDNATEPSSSAADKSPK